MFAAKERVLREGRIDSAINNELAIRTASTITEKIAKFIEKRLNIVLVEGFHILSNFFYYNLN
jgi:hypothetical protein